MERDERTAAIILAAGASSRMGRTKALLPDEQGTPFVTRLARTCREAGVATIVVVTGSQHEAIAEALQREPIDVRLARNGDPSRGQLSSLWVGLDAVRADDPDAVLMTLVDVPLAAAATVRAVIDAWRTTRAPIVRPAIGERHGHPVLFDRTVLDELMAAPLDGGAKTVVHAHAADIVNVPVEDEGALADMDTPEEYARLIGRNVP